jgi:hypothetical protein
MRSHFARWLCCKSCAMSASICYSTVYVRCVSQQINQLILEMHHDALTPRPDVIGILDVDLMITHRHLCAAARRTLSLCSLSCMETWGILSSSGKIIAISLVCVDAVLLQYCITRRTETTAKAASKKRRRGRQQK